MAKRDRREAPRGEEEETFDSLVDLSSKQWAELLKDPLALERAAAKGNRALALRLVGAGAEIGNALFEAVDGGHKELVNDLVESGVPVAARDTDVWSPLHLAARLGGVEMVELLLAKGADKDSLDQHNRTPLYLATEGDHVAAALALLAVGADVSIMCSGLFKTSVVHMAAEWGYLEILRAVIEHGADLEVADEPNYRTALHCAATRDRVEAIHVLVEAGANIEAQGNGGRTPLHYAASHLHRNALSALLKHGAPVNSHDYRRQTPLYFAAREAGLQGAAEVVDFLLRSGGDETIVNDKGKAAAGVVGEIGTFLQEAYDKPAEDVDLVHQLLASATADRAWRRRGYLVLCRAHPDRVQLTMQESSSGPAGVAGKTRSAEASGCTGTVGSSTAYERTGGGWTGAVAMVLGLQEEDVFRTVVKFL